MEWDNVEILLAVAMQVLKNVILITKSLRAVILVFNIIPGCHPGPRLP